MTTWSIERRSSHQLMASPAWPAPTTTVVVRARRGTRVFRRENFRMIGMKGEFGLVLLLGAQSVEAFDGGTALRALHPLAGCAPFELRGFRRLGQGFARAEQCFDVHAVVDGFFCRGSGHDFLLHGLTGGPQRIAPNLFPPYALFGNRYSSRLFGCGIAATNASMRGAIATITRVPGAD